MGQRGLVRWSAAAGKSGSSGNNRNNNLSKPICIMALAGLLVAAQSSQMSFAAGYSALNDSEQEHSVLVIGMDDKDELQPGDRRQAAGRRYDGGREQPESSILAWSKVQAAAAQGGTDTASVPPRMAALDQQVPLAVDGTQMEIKPCTVAMMHTGSLRRNILRALHGCGLRMGYWFPGDSQQMIDWMIPVEYDLNHLGLQDYFDFLQSNYGITAHVRATDGTVDFMQSSNNE